jgi:hypothetical protein
MGYTLVIIKIRFENHAVILHFPHFRNKERLLYINLSDT